MGLARYIRQSSGPASDRKPTTRPPSQSEEILLESGEHDIQTIPPSWTELDGQLALPEQAFLDRLEDRARRAELLTALLQAKGLSPAQGMRALQAALAAVVTSAEESNLQSLAVLARSLHAVVGELGVAETRPVARTMDVLVFDDGEISRDLVALAVEAQGHMVRSANGYDDFVRLLDERLPDLIITEIDLKNAPARHFCNGLRELLANRSVPLVFFSGLPSAEIEQYATRLGARAAISKENGIAALVPALERVFRGL